MKNIETEQLLIIGIGNSGRRDDGLGWALLDRLKERNKRATTFEYRYQLQIEDAALIAQYSRVLFIDATHDALPKGFSISVLKPKPATTYTSHAIPPAQILYWCQDLYEQYPQCHLLTITGYEWRLQLGISKEAKQNLDLAGEYLWHWLERQKNTASYLKKIE